jgi:hypothetical protein
MDTLSKLNYGFPPQELSHLIPNLAFLLLVMIQVSSFASNSNTVAASRRIRLFNLFSIVCQSTIKVLQDTLLYLQRCCFYILHIPRVHLVCTYTVVEIPKGTNTCFIIPIAFTFDQFFIF